MNAVEKIRWMDKHLDNATMAETALHCSKCRIQRTHLFLKDPKMIDGYFCEVCSTRANTPCHQEAKGIPNDIRELY